MGRALWTGVALLALAAGCAGGKAEQRPAPVAEKTLTGNLAFVDARSLMVSNPSQPEAPARLLSRGKDATVLKDGHEVGWDQLSEGDEVRVSFKEQSGAPSEVQRVEVLGTQEPMPPEQMPSPELPDDQH